MLPTWLELRMALRTLRRSTAFATFSILALALAITANATIASLVDAIVRPEMALPHPERLLIATFKPGPRPPHDTVATARPMSIRAALGDSGRTYAAVTGAPDMPASYDWPIQAGDRHLQAQLADVAANYFQVVGARPLYGGLFADSSAAAAHQVVIADRLWRQVSTGHDAFAPFPISILYAMGTETYTVVGVLPPNGAPPLGADIFVPSEWTGQALIRLRPAVTPADAERELDVRAPMLDAFHSPRAHFELTPAVVSPAHRLDLVAALAACALAVLLIACANIATLLVARGLSRSRELATRLAFGASRWQLARLLFAESGLVALAGGVLGGVLSLWTIHAVQATLPPNLQYLGLVRPQLSWRVMAAGVGVTAFAATIFGVVPVVALLRRDVGMLMRGGSRHLTVGGARFRLLVVVEVAGALTLVVAASLLGAVAGRVSIVDYGYNAGHLLRATVREAPAKWGPPLPTSAVVAAKRFGELESVRAMPGVVAATEQWPWFTGGRVRVDDPGGGDTRSLIAASQVITVQPDYLRVLGLKVVRGRDFHASEDDPLPSVIINQIAAHWLWPGADPIGRLVQFSPRLPWMRVVGIVGQTNYDVRCMDEPCSDPLFLIAAGAAYRAPEGAVEFVVRTTGDPSALVGRLRQKLAADYPAAAPSLETWDQVTGFATVTKLYDFVGALVGAFAIVGLLLAAIGVYGVAAFAVALRAREFGVRIALGAGPRDIVLIVLRDGNATALLGLAVGLLFANWAEGLLAHYLFGYDSLAPYFMAVSVVVLFAATVLAGLSPALRASRTNPVDTLRSE